jgi:hypoxanthine phosphoribosyltransferase
MFVAYRAAADDARHDADDGVTADEALDTGNLPGGEDVLGAIVAPHTHPNSSSTTSVAATKAAAKGERTFRWYRGVKTPRFVNDSERDCAEILDFYGVPWEYEPVTFVLETDEAGRVTEAFSPDFYLPEQNLFLEVTTMRQELVTRKNRKVRKLRQRYPDVNVKLFYRRDIEALGQKLASRLPAPPRQTHAPLADEQPPQANAS